VTQGTANYAKKGVDPSKKQHLYSVDLGNGETVVLKTDDAMTLSQQRWR
jgi:hypothetical protein